MPTPIRPDYTPHSRAERLIAAGRFALAFFSLVAVYIEPSTPAKFQRATYSLLVIYTIVALALMLVEFRRPRPMRRWQLASHAAELVLFSIFIYLTEGPASPFFLYFIFSLFCAMLRFTWRGILATAVVAMTVYGTMSFVAALGDPTIAVSRVVIREAYVAVIAALLVYLGMYQQRLRGELTSLAAWPRELASDVDALLQGTLAHAAAVLKARRVLLLWEESEEPWVYTATWDDGEFLVDRMAPGKLELTGAAALRNTSFFARGAEQTLLVYDPATSSAEERTADPFGRAFRLRFGIHSAIAASVESETLKAHVIVPEVRSATADDLALTHIVGRLILATLEQFFFVRQVRLAASADERMRISRELHDGIVQSLGGAGLQLQAIRKQLPRDFPASERLGHVQRVIEHDQRELRAIVRELRPHDARDGRTILEEELQRISERYPLEWGLAVEVDVEQPLDLPPRLANELSRIVNESLSNAARHGGATQAKVTVAAESGTVLLRVADNGRGFSFTGRFDLDALTRTGSGPRTLKERVSALGGSLTVESAPGGASIDARIPIRPEGVR